MKQKVKLMKFSKLDKLCDKRMKMNTIPLNTKLKGTEGIIVVELIKI